MKRIFLFALIFPLITFGQYQNYVAIGDSMTAAFSSYSLVESAQKNSYPALIARQLGISDFQQPLVSEPGIPAQLELVSLSPLTIAPKSDSTGVPINLTLPRPYNNLGVVGATLYDCLNTQSDSQQRHDLVLRGLGTQVQQAIYLQPDLLTVWIGANDALGAVLSCTAVEGITLTPKTAFHDQYAQLLDTLTSQTQADLVVGNVPPVTANPFITTIPPFIINPATGEPVIGPDGHPMTYIGQSDSGALFISPDSYISLYAKAYIQEGIGIPKGLGGTGNPLPDSVVLTPNEAAKIEEYATSYNASISELAQSHGIPVFDAHALLEDLDAHGLEVAGIELNSDFLTGGIFSYDGFHPTSLGYAVVANAFIKTINAAHGQKIKSVALFPFLTDTTPDLGGAACCQNLTLLGWETGFSWLCPACHPWNRHAVDTLATPRLP
jgi:lysophospholipase L1-like esterase